MERKERKERKAKKGSKKRKARQGNGKIGMEKKRLKKGTNGRIRGKGRKLNISEERR